MAKKSSFFKPNYSDSQKAAIQRGAAQGSRVQPPALGVRRTIGKAGTSMLKAAFGRVSKKRVPAKNLNTDKMNSYWKRQELYRRKGMTQAKQRNTNK